MEKEQEREWEEAQKIAISVDLVSVAKNQLKFLAAVDRNRYLYEGPLLEWAIYRYNAYWLPLLAKHMENTTISDGPLVVPLDCEWIWHCHRLNPVRYKSDCEMLFGRILGTHNVISSVEGTPKTKTEEVWSKMYPEEPYELDPNRTFLDVSQKNIQSENFTSYDLVSAVKRQVSFCYQVSRPHMTDDLFLEEALARYKGFLHLIRIKGKNGVKRFCVPTYDVDLMWHSHQLHPVSYCNDLMKLLGMVLQHDDADSDRTKGGKLDTGFTGTTKQWKHTFGLSYWKAGARYRGNTPTPVTQIPYPFVYEGKKFHEPDNFGNLIQLPEVKAMEIFLEFVEVKNLPEADKVSLCVSFCKKHPGKLTSANKTLKTILPKLEENQAAYFQCDSTGELLFELSSSNKAKPESFKPFGTCSLSVQECLISESKLSVDKWLQVVPVTSSLLASNKPILLHVSLSFTPPTPKPLVFHLVHPKPLFKGSYLLPLPEVGKERNSKDDHTFVIDDDGNGVLSLHIREVSKTSTRSIPDLLKEVICIKDSGEAQTLAAFQGNEWVIKESHGSLKLCCTSGNNDDYIYELVGHKMVRLYAGRKLDYEPKQCENQRCEHDFMTAVEFSGEYPYGRALALFDFKHGILKVMDEWMILTSITLAFILNNILRSKGCFTIKVGCEDISVNMEKGTNCGSQCVEMAKCSGGSCHGGGCGRGCGAETAKSGKCQNFYANMEKGSNCGSQCVEMAKCSGGSCRGGGCGGGCGAETVNSVKCQDISVNMEKGSNCGSQCAEMAKCSGGSCRGGGCGGGCGAETVKSVKCQDISVNMEKGSNCCTSCVEMTKCSGGSCRGGGCGGGCGAEIAKIGKREDLSVNMEKGSNCCTSCVEMAKYSGGSCRGGGCGGGCGAETAQNGKCEDISVNMEKGSNCCTSCVEMAKCSGGSCRGGGCGGGCGNIAV